MSYLTQEELNKLMKERVESQRPLIELVATLQKENEVLKEQNLIYKEALVVAQQTTFSWMSTHEDYLLKEHKLRMRIGEALEEAEKVGK